MKPCKYRIHTTYKDGAERLLCGHHKYAGKTEPCVSWCCEDAETGGMGAKILIGWTMMIAGVGFLGILAGIFICGGLEPVDYLIFGLNVIAVEFIGIYLCNPLLEKMNTLIWE